VRIVHIIPGLATGGAQAMLAKLLEAGSGGPEQLVISLRPDGGLRARIEATGVELADLGLNPGEISPKALAQLARRLRRWRPDLVHGWMYHGNLAALLAGWLSGRRPSIIWNIRHSLHDLGREKRGTRAVIRVGARLSPFVSTVIYNAHVSARQHEALGYAGGRAEIIPNGFDTDLFRPDPEVRAAWRARLGVSPSTLLIGHVARYHPMKDHASLIRAAGQLAAKGVDLFLVMVGEDVTPQNQELASVVASAGLAERVALLGERSDIPGIVPAFDLAVLCSAWGEGFPNVLGEAMACGVPCVATDVGDCGRLLTAGGTLVAVRDPDALAAAMEQLLRLPEDRRREIGAAGRERVAREYALSAIAQRYTTLYARLADAAGRSQDAAARASVKADLRPPSPLPGSERRS
jgi:glycosyltransferase involved in cell wall biosynthesis